MKYALIKRTDKYLLKNCLVYKRAVRKYGKENVQIEWTFIDNYECANEKPKERFLIQFIIYVTYKDEFAGAFHISDDYCECTNTMKTFVDTAWVYYKDDLGYKR
jgi:hypothetical protein